MGVRGFAVATSTALTLLWFSASVEAEKDHLLRLPGSVLQLVYPPGGLTLTTGEKTQRLVEEEGESYVTPSISADGRVIATGRRVGSNPTTGYPRYMVSTYSMTDNRWTDYKDLEFERGPVSISRDGSKLAFVTLGTAEAPSRLQIVDRASGKVIVGQDPSREAQNITWSPDGRRIVFDMYIQPTRSQPEIPSHAAVFVMDTQTGVLSRVTDGRFPSWSPSGEWIVYFAYTPKKNDGKGGWYFDPAQNVSLIHPDGTGSRVIVKFAQSVNLTPVWSPDSKAILMYKFRDEAGWINTYKLDLDTLKVTKIFKKNGPVYGWAAVR